MLLLHRRLITLAGGLIAPIAVITALGLAATAAWVTQSLLIAGALASVLADSASVAGASPAGRLGVAFVVLLTAVVSTRAVLLWLREVSAQWAGSVVKRRLRRRLYGHLLDLGPGWMQGTRTGRLQSVLVDGVEGLEGYYTRYLPQVAVALIGSTAILLYLATLDPVVAVTLAVAVLALPVAPRLWERLLASRGQAHWDAYQQVNADYVDAMTGMTTLKAFGAAHRRGAYLREQTWRLYRSTMGQLAVSLIGTGLTTLLVGLGTAVAVVVAVVRYGTGDLNAVEVLTVLLLASECFRPFAALAGYWHLSYLGFSAADDIAEVLQARPAVGSPSTGDVADTSRLRRPLGAALRGVTFTHAGANTPTLRDVDLQVPPGATVALVGASGAGKTTVAALLVRLHDPDVGSVEIGGIDLRRLTPQQARSLVAVVPQDPFLFSGSIADNIRLGRLDAADGDVVGAARAAGLDDFIASLPEGYATAVGERGAWLSGGQRQRVAIARALLVDAPVLILDEATSAVDPHREAGIQDALAAASVGRTVLIIAHRLSTVAAADQIVVIDDGAITESGTHHDLLDRGGAYARLVAAQGAT